MAKNGGRSSADFQFENRIAYATNRSIPTQPSARAYREDEFSYLDRQKWRPEEGDRRRRSSGDIRAKIAVFRRLERRPISGEGWVVTPRPSRFDRQHCQHDALKGRLINTLSSRPCGLNVAKVPFRDGTHCDPHNLRMHIMCRVHRKLNLEL
ncbi:hypothetical protein L3X38_024246 [Prunus dulcis]|uniref:Uncharacterized protein n=1 Tax=Prunus dulcis TaxID=3755 RepID=A0AAD4VZK2_PRUDU|nr:hypothetical protein L3X38_024246 [Prunus dulcis]